MKDIARAIEHVRVRLTVAELSIGSYKRDPQGWPARHREAMAGLAAELTAELGARINYRRDGARVRIAGVSASSTSGLSGALRNWIKGASKRLPY